MSRLPETSESYSWNVEEGKAVDNEEKINKKNLLTIWWVTQQFSDNSTMHGLRYVFRTDASMFRRLLWITFILGGMAYCSFIIYRSINDFCMYPTIMKVKNRFEQESKFPALTICPYNLFRGRSFSDEGISYLNYVYGNGSQVFETNMSESNFIMTVSKNYLKEIWCVFQLHNCTSQQLTISTTDMGRCITFDPGLESPQSVPGSIGGLDVHLPYSLADWAPGPFMLYEGFKVATHDPGSKTRAVRDRGFSLIPGYITEVTLTRREFRLMTPPHGECGSVPSRFSPYKRRNCLIECEAKYIITHCGCYFEHHVYEGPLCSMADLQRCGHILWKSYLTKAIFEYCNCPQECSYTEYQTTVRITKPTPMIKYAIGLKENLTSCHLRIFYEDLGYTETSEHEEYSFEKLMCDIGGAGGLFLGCSFATLFEFCDFSFELFWIWLCGKVKWIARRH